jgi:hypothetical protein
MAQRASGGQDDPMRFDPTTAELDHRSSNGIEVSLLWSRRTNRLKVAVLDTATGDEFEVLAAPEKALDVFHHPYAYRVAA